MDKIAQRRGLLSKIREKVSPGGKLMETFSPEFRELMENLREVDDNIRNIAIGEGEDTLKHLLKAAKTNFNRREYMTAIAYLGRFKDRLDLIGDELAKLKQNVDIKHHEFLFGGLDPEHLTYLTDQFGESFSRKKKSDVDFSDRAVIEKEAGITDWWYNLTSDRGKTLSAWEKRFPQEARDIKRQTSNLIAKSETLLSATLSTLKSLDAFRSARKLEGYLSLANKLRDKYRAYNSAFASFYNNKLKGLIDYQRGLQTPAELKTEVDLTPPAEETTSEEPKETPKEEAKTTPTRREPFQPQRLPFPPQREPFPGKWRPPLPFTSRVGVPEEVPPKVIEEVAPDTVRSPPPSMEPEVDLVNPVIPKPPIVPKDIAETAIETVKPPKKANHEEFLNKMANIDYESPFVVAREIIKYAESIKETDQEANTKLIEIASTILRQ